MARCLKWLLRSVACWAHAHTESTGDTWNELTSQRHTSSRVLSKLLQQLSTVRGLVRKRPWHGPVSSANGRPLPSMRSEQARRSACCLAVRVRGVCVPHCLNDLVASEAV